jgi:hypothetical protein
VRQGRVSERGGGGGSDAATLEALRRPPAALGAAQPPPPPAHCAVRPLAWHSGAAALRDATTRTRCAAATSTVPVATRNSRATAPGAACWRRRAAAVDGAHRSAATALRRHSRRRRGERGEHSREGRWAAPAPSRLLSPWRSPWPRAARSSRRRVRPWCGRSARAARRWTCRWCAGRPAAAAAGGRRRRRRRSLAALSLSRTHLGPPPLSLTHPFPLNRRRTPPKKRNKNR